jgi:hypothetical protein
VRASDFPPREAQDYTERSRNGYRQKDTDEAEQPPEGEQRKHHPDSIEVDAPTDQVWREHIVGKHFTDNEDAAHKNDRRPIGPELIQRNVSANAVA